MTLHQTRTDGFHKKGEFLTLHMKDIPVDCQFNTDITCMKNHLNTDYKFYTDCYVLKIKVVLWPLEIITRQLKFCLATKLSCLVVNGPLHFKSYFDG